MIWLYFTAVCGFYIFSAVRTWSNFEKPGAGVEVLKSFLGDWMVYSTYALIFGLLGPFFNYDTILVLAQLGYKGVVVLPDGLPIFRSFTVGLGGPLAAVQLFSLNNKRSGKAEEVQRDDVLYGSARSIFWRKSKMLFGIVP